MITGSASERTAAGSAPALVDRERELACIDAALASAKAGTGTTLLIEGAAGIGKTALLCAARELARADGFTVVHARGRELESDYPFGVVRQCLEPTVRAARGRERDVLLTGAAGLAAPIVLDGPGEQGADTTYGTLHGLYWLLSNLAERAPILLAVDDAQWADEPSLRFVQFLVHRVESLPVALVLALRRADTRGDRSDALAALRTDPVVELRTPAPLGEDAVDRFLGVSAAGPTDPRVVRACHEATGGNPFLLVELVRALREEGVALNGDATPRVNAVAPGQITRNVQARLARLSRSAQDLARAVAVLGDDAPLELAAALADLEIDAAADAAHVLRDAELLDHGRRLRFCHPLLHGAVSDGLNARERDRTHRRAVDLLRARAAAPEQIAVHILASTPGHGSDDIHTLRAAARRAHDRGAPDAAAPPLLRILEEAIDPSERSDVLLELGTTQLTAGQQDAARHHLGEVARCAPSAVARAEAAVALATISQPDLDYWRALAPILDAALDDLDDGERELTLTAETARLLVCTILGDLRGPRATSIAARFARLAGDTAAECAALAQLAEHRRLLGAGAAELGDLAERATRTADMLLETGVDAPAIYYLLEMLRCTDRLDAAERLADRGIAISRARGAARSSAAGYGHRSEIQRRRGRLREAEADARTATAIPPSDPVWRALPQTALARCLLDRGDVDGALQACSATGLGEHVPDFGPLTMYLFMRMRLRAAQGEHAAALADFADGCRRSGPSDAHGALVEEYLVAVDSHLAQGDTSAAAALLARTVQLAERWGTIGALGQTVRARARATTGDGAITLLHEATEMLERSPLALEHARALVDLGASLRRAGHRQDARQPLRDGYQAARECGADTLAETARVELAASGIRLRRPALTGAESLTPSERRIADLAAASATNAEIAQALFITIKTVEMHLTNAYRKLGITTRTQLNRALATR